MEFTKNQFLLAEDIMGLPSSDVAIETSLMSIGEQKKAFLRYR